jgi:hypothetical protein
MPKNAALWRFVDLLFEFHKHLVVTTEAYQTNKEAY